MKLIDYRDQHWFSAHPICGCSRPSSADWLCSQHKNWNTYRTSLVSRVLGESEGLEYLFVDSRSVNTFLYE